MKDDLSKYKCKGDLLKAIESSPYHALPVKFAPLNYYIKVLKELGFVFDKDDFDINEDQIDFFAYFEGDLYTLELSGSLFHGNFKLQIT
jgi:hypothetical protein